MEVSVDRCKRAASASPEQYTKDSSQVDIQSRAARGEGEIDVKSTRAGSLHTHKGFRSEFLVKERDVIVYLPPGYEAEAARRYPVLYLQDGQNLFDGATAFIFGQYWRVGETADALIGE